MKVYAIHDGGLDRATPIGYLYCYEKAESYIIELCSDLTQWEAPLLFQGLVKRGIYTIPRDISMLWVRERVIPSGRQNIGLILKNANLREYSEGTLLSLSKARCSQDECYISEIKEGEIPDDIAMRSAENVAECFPSEDGQMICLFRDNLVSKVDLNHIAKNHKEIEYVIGNKGLLNTVKIGAGGYSIVFNDSIEILKTELRRKEWILPVSARDFYGFVNRDIVNSYQACEMLKCTKQNLSYLVKTEQLTPVIYGLKENFYTKGSIQKILDK